MRRKSIHSRPSWKSASAVTIAALLGLTQLTGEASGQVVEPGPLAPLTGVEPMLPDLSPYVDDPAMLELMGKALFWDVKVGSDGVACASCHFAGGADVRTRNQIAPGADDVFEIRPINNPTGANKFFTATDWNLDGRALGFHVPPIGSIAPHEDGSVVRHVGDDRASSQGTFGGTLERLIIRDARERCSNTITDPFSINMNRRVRIVEPRNTPTVINAVFNLRQFWDGRANNVFNGVDPFGVRSHGDPNAGIAVSNGSSVQLEQIAIENASLASQAVGPPLSEKEMSCGNKIFADIGRKLLPQKALASQRVHPDDSLFGPSGMIAASGIGLDESYGQLIFQTFNPNLWSAQGAYRKVNGAFVACGSTSEAGCYSQIEWNFSLFWGLALHQYQASLVSDQTQFDSNTMSASARRGMAVFENEGRCIECHQGPLMSGATAGIGLAGPFGGPIIENMAMGFDGLDAAVYDTGFYNIGVTPTVEDVGLGGTDPFGKPLSFTRQAQFPGAATQLGNTVPLTVDTTLSPATLLQEVPLTDADLPNPRDAIDGAFKTPILRNVALNPPYFHDGSAGDLMQVIDFYNRGGNRECIGPCSSEIDTTGFDSTGLPNGQGQTAPSNLDADIVGLGLTDQQKRDLRNFMLALTDFRVACHSGKFDHPELPIANGQRNSPAIVDDLTGDVLDPRNARDRVILLPAVGRNGLTACFPNNGIINSQRAHLERIAPIQ